MDSKTLTIGIPAYNESGNILSLLSDLKGLLKSKFVISKIIVVSDGSSDNTAQKVRSLKDSHIYVIDSKERKGVAFRQNELMASCKSDYLLILNADIRIKDPRFLAKIYEKINSSHIDLLAVRLTPVPPKGFFEKIIYESVEFKNKVFETVNKGDNLFTCHGTVRIFSKKLYSSLRFSGSVNEDAYSYLYCLNQGLKYGYEDRTEAYYRLPTNFTDHKRQSTRFLSNREELDSEFGKEIVTKEYTLPMNVVIKIGLSHFIKHPLEMITYIAVSFFIKVTCTFFPKPMSHTWDLATSTKSVEISAL